MAQYTEPVPTACGTHRTGTGNENRKRPVPKAIQQKIDQQGGSDKQALETIVSQESAGAPQTAIQPHKTVAKSKKHKTKTKANPGSSTKRILSDSETRKSNPLAASVGVITDGSDGRLIALIALMLAVALVVVVSAFRRRRVR